ncbi:Serine proteinase stubble [Nymphon striatum]|nr:Serine proteinase stubble [Nymphon striatum]
MSSISTLHGYSTWHESITSSTLESCNTTRCNLEVPQRPDFVIVKAEDAVTNLVLIFGQLKAQTNSIKSCGVTNFRQGKVVGGSQANPGQYPWVVSIRLQANALLNPVHFCGGVIIGRKWILTAAHCIARYKSSRFTIRVGSFYRSNDNDPLLEDFKVKKIILHPSYTYPNYYNDIAIMKLDRSITYKGSHVLPICLPPHESDYVGVNAIVAGWGWLDEDRNKLMQPNTLHHVVLPVRDHATCQGFYTKRRITLLRTQLCAGFKEGGKDSCQGDSGGPLLWEENGQTYVIGIVSAGIGCARPKLPGLYTKRNNRYRSEKACKFTPPPVRPSWNMAITCTRSLTLANRRSFCNSVLNIYFSHTCKLNRIYTLNPNKHIHKFPPPPVPANKRGAQLVLNISKLPLSQAFITIFHPLSRGFRDLGSKNSYNTPKFWNMVSRHTSLSSLLQLNTISSDNVITKIGCRLQINILLKPVHFCGGVIIGGNWILTAAHCLSRYKPSMFTVRAGSFFRSNNNDPLLEDFKVTKIILHPSYTYPNYYHDIAIMKLDRSITYKGSNVLPICLPPHESDYVGVNAIVAGWGWLDEDRNKAMQPDALHHVVLPVLDHATCQGFYTSRKITLLRTQMCAGYKEGGKDSCQADSGGPLLWEENGHTYVIGIVSAGIGCARPQLPGLYTKVSHYRNWILENIDKPDSSSS